MRIIHQLRKGMAKKITLQSKETTRIKMTILQLTVSRMTRNQIHKTWLRTKIKRKPRMQKSIKLITSRRSQKRRSLLQRLSPSKIKNHNKMMKVKSQRRTRKLQW
jgi:hypothetical protein